MESYMEAIRQAVVLFPAVAVLFTVPYVAYNYHKYGSVLSLRVLIVYSFMLYLLCVYCLVILPLPTGEAAAALHGHRAQLIPFTFIGDIMEHSHAVWDQPMSWLSLVNNRAFLTNLFNLLMTMPFGVYLRYYFRRSWGKTLLYSFLLSLFFELTQLTGLYFIYPGSYRMFDVDDLIVNTCGSMAGYALAYFAVRFLPTREELDQGSFARGQRVSFPRRVLAFLYDAAVCLLLSLPLAAVCAASVGIVTAGTFPLLWLAYFCLCPVLLRGQTAGHRLTKLKIVSMTGRTPRWYQYVFRYGSLFAVLLLAPYLLDHIVSRLAARGVLSALAALTAYGVIRGGYAFLLLFEAVRMAMRRRLFYETLSNTQVVSTIAEPSPTPLARFT